MERTEKRQNAFSRYQIQAWEHIAHCTPPPHRLHTRRRQHGQRHVCRHTTTRGIRARLLLWRGGRQARQQVSQRLPLHRSHLHNVGAPVPQTTLSQHLAQQATRVSNTDHDAIQAKQRWFKTTRILIAERVDTSEQTEPATVQGTTIPTPGGQASLTAPQCSH
jgi:hypothetical protein